MAVEDQEFPETCVCGMWPYEEYGERCPSCPGEVCCPGEICGEPNLFEILVSEEEFRTAYAPAESFEGTYEPTQSPDAPPRFIGSTDGRWVHQTMGNLGCCTRCHRMVDSGWSWFEKSTSRYFTCDDCAEGL